MAKKKVEVVINFLEEEESVDFETNDPIQMAVTLVSALSGYCVDEGIEIFVGGKQIHP